MRKGLACQLCEFIHSYCKNRVQITKINSEYSSWKEILFGIQQRSILGPLILDLLDLLDIITWIYSLLWKTLTLQAMQMITQHTTQKIHLEK